MSMDHIYGKSALVQVMAWCRQATSHYLSQYWPRSQSPYDVTRPQWVNKPRAKGKQQYFARGLVNRIFVECEQLAVYVDNIWATYLIAKNNVAFYTNITVRWDWLLVCVCVSFITFPQRLFPMMLLIQKADTWLKQNNYQHGSGQITLVLQRSFNFPRAISTT